MARTATHHGLPFATRYRATTAPQAAVNPAARSISPSSSTKTSAMPSVMMNAAWVIRLTRLPADRNSELLTWKIKMMTIRPMITGRAPLSPLRIRLTQIRAYSPTELAISSAEAPGSAAATSFGSPPGWSCSVPTPPGSSGGGFVDANGQPSGRLSGVRARLSGPLALASRVRCVAPLVIRSTADAVS